MELNYNVKLTWTAAPNRDYREPRQQSVSFQIQASSDRDALKQAVSDSYWRRNHDDLATTSFNVGADKLLSIEQAGRPVAEINDDELTRAFLARRLRIAEREREHNQRVLEHSDERRRRFEEARESGTLLTSLDEIEADDVTQPLPDSAQLEL